MNARPDPVTLVHLAGKGVNKRTGMTFRGSTSWGLRLAAGMYRYGTD